MNIETQLSNRNPLISVIVPVYNTEQYLPRCLESLIHQTYSELEIIIVNDCSPGNAKTIVEDYQLQDSRIKYVEHEHNKGLFHARVTGSEYATGDYIAFVDSDDYVTIDYYRILVEKAVQENADIVEGRIIREKEDGYQFVQNNNNILFKRLEGEEIKRIFFSQEGIFFHWHVIWNKLYKMELWKKCLPYFKKQNKHLIMTEDVVFSSLLFCNASKYCSVEYDGYFYTIRSDASTGAEDNLDKFIKYFSDMGTAFDFVESYLKASELHDQYGEHLLNWKKRYFRLWANRIKSMPTYISAKTRALNALKEAMNIDQVEPVEQEDYFHNIISTPWDSRYEEIKKQIADDNIEYVSFDIFDTLILRPFFNPRDLLYILDDYFHKLCPESKLVEFSSIRLQAEEKARELIKHKKPSWQDVNLNEIYQYIQDEYGFSADVAEKMKEKEIELEIHFSHRRNSIYELFQLAKKINKKIIIISDMYLPESVIRMILEHAGYSGYEKLYVSSEVRLLKHTGDLYQYVLDDLDIEPDRILHIGDNWNSDIVMAKKAGLRAHFVPKTTDLLFNALGDKESGNSIDFFKDHLNHGWTTFEFPQYFSTRCMLAMVANKIFDHPYPSFNPDSDFNIDPYFIGYYALGMHVFGLVDWLLKDSIKKGYGTIYFIARDGYLPFKAYEIMSKAYPGAPKSSYIYASRRSLIPYVLLTNKYGLDSFISLHAHSPKSILKLFQEVLRDDLNLKQFEKEGIILSKNFSSSYEFKKFIDIFIQEGIDLQKTERYIERLKKYFSVIQENDATFDLGYSARMQTVFVDIIGRRCDAYFVHTSTESAKIYSRRYGFEVNSFYELKPLISGILREHFFAELGPSCIGYEQNENGDIQPKFEQFHKHPINELMINTLQQACLDFATDMVNVFNDYIPKLTFRNQEVSLPFESYIHYSKPCDRTIFMCSYSDDIVHGGKNKNNILSWWNAELIKVASRDPVQYSMNPRSYSDFLFGHSKLKKAIFYGLFDRDTLKAKVKECYKNRPVILKTLTGSYRLLRKMKRTFIK